jgi:hypothetical protein
MILSDNRCALCAKAALRVRIMLEKIAGAGIIANMFAHRIHST